MCCVPGGGVCFPAGGVCWEGLVGLLKLSQPGRYWQAWKILASLENTGSGTGGYVFVRISVFQRPGLCRYSTEKITVVYLTANIRLWYNVYNERREKLYNMTESQETGKNAPVKRFYPLGYKIPSSRQKRRTANLHKIWEYKKHEIVRRRWTAEKRHTYIYKKGFLLKMCHAVTKL